MKLHIYLIGMILCNVIVLTLAKPQDDEEGEEEEDEATPPRSCQKIIGDFVMGILNSTLKCLGGQSTFRMATIFELGTRSGCLLKCTLQEEGIVGMEDGLFDKIAAAFYFEEKFPKVVRDITLPAAQGCFPLADEFNPKEYWCGSYLPFIECAFRAILKGLIPFAGECVANPVIGILFSVFKYLTPQNYDDLGEDMNELRRAVANATRYKCFNQNCTELYEYKKVNGTNSIVVYNKDLQVLSVETKKPKQQFVPEVETNQFSNQFSNKYENKYQGQYQNKYQFQYTPKYSPKYSA